jgi:hypothetical protein
MTKKFQVAFTPADTILYPFRYSLALYETKEEAEQVCVECALKRQSFTLKGTDFVERLTTDIPGAYCVVEISQ